MNPFLKTPMAFRPGSRTLPGRYFTSAEVFAADTERIFLREWLCAGHGSRIPQAGDYFLLEALGASVIIVRGQDNVVRAFHNLCRHRGTRLCEQAEGRLGKSIQCPYHAWTYALDGTLIGAPMMKDVPDFQKEDHALHSLPLHVWEGFIFLNFGRSPQPFEQRFAPLLTKFADWNLPMLRPAQRIVYDVQANWKLIFQNYNECYHCAPVHPQLVKLSPFDSGENDLIEGPFLGGFMLIEGESSLTLSGKTCALRVGDLQPEDRQRVYYYSISPNMLLSLHRDYVMLHTLWPHSPGRTLITCEWLFHPDNFSHPGFHPEDGVEFWDMTNRQDWHLCELGQLGVSSPAYQTGPYSLYEALPAAFDRHYLELMQAAENEKAQPAGRLG
jgi:Rieske 2Fe-2S family protein